ncbi:MAG: thermonuclease family protein [Candidatus Diapherotrites archaeon]|nr:thermonuclease family protein [Candidatus Diapherotrites archaeon]
MNSKLLILFFALILFFGCAELINEIPSNKVNNEEIPKDVFIVSRAVDGDTLELMGGEKVRLLGINTPEKNEFYYTEAKQKLIDLTEGKQIELIYGKEKTDMYGRTLAFVLVDGMNVNLMLVRLGLATTYMLDGLQFKEELLNEEKFAREKENGLWKKSESSLTECIELKELNAKEEFVEFINDCNYLIDLNALSVKDAGRNKYVFNAVELDFNESVTLYSGKGIDLNNSFYWNSTNIWNNDSDYLFVRDENGMLVLFYEY